MLLRIAAAVAIVTLVSPLTTGQSELVIYKEGSSVYHRPGCPALKDPTGVMAMTRAQAESRGYKPHAECDPERKPTDGAQEAPAAPPPTVYWSDSRYYHRKDCVKLATDPKRIHSESLEVAGKTHWPCPVCKPPVRKRSANPAAPGTGRRGR
jgi:hypothetical protein